VPFILICITISNKSNRAEKINDVYILWSHRDYHFENIQYNKDGFRDESKRDGCADKKPMEIFEWYIIMPYEKVLN
jgi:hypothetical protein